MVLETRLRLWSILGEHHTVMHLDQSLCQQTSFAYAHVRVSHCGSLDKTRALLLQQPFGHGCGCLFDRKHRVLDIDVSSLVLVPGDTHAPQGCLLIGEDGCRNAKDAGVEL